MTKTNDPEYNFYLITQNPANGVCDLVPITEHQSKLYTESDRYFKHASYSGLFSEDEGILAGIANPTIVRNSEVKTINPITRDLKNALCNMYESDPYVQSMLDIINLYTLSGDITAELQPVNAHKFKTKEEINTELYKYVKQDEVENFNDTIATLDENINLWHFVSIANIQRKVYGLAAIWKSLTTEAIKDKKMKIDIPANAPLQLITLDPYYLDQAVINKETHLITHYYYTDPNMSLIAPKKPFEITENKLKKIQNVNYRLIKQRTEDDPLKQNLLTDPNAQIKLPVSQMIVFINNNNQITPNTYGYGSSDLLPIISLSSNTRRINEKILPQINETQYLGVGILKIKSDSNVDMDKLRDRINKAGGRFATNADIEYIEINNKFDMEGTLNQRQLNIRNMLMKFQIPSPIFNFEDIANKATIDTVVTFLVRVIDRERKYIENILYRQYYLPLMSLYFKDKKYLNYRVRVKLDFPPIDFTSLLDKIAAWLAAYKVDVITKPEYREFIGIEPFAAQDARDESMTFQQTQMVNAVNNSMQQSFLKNTAKTNLNNSQLGATSANNAAAKKPADTMPRTAKKGTGG